MYPTERIRNCYLIQLRNKSAIIPVATNSFNFTNPNLPAQKYSRIFPCFDFIVLSVLFLRYIYFIYQNPRIKKSKANGGRFIRTVSISVPWARKE